MVLEWEVMEVRLVTKKTISKECWNLDYELVKWLNEHLKVYREEAIKVVNLEFYKFEYKKKEYTQLEILDRLIDITNTLLETDYFDCDVTKTNKLKNEMYDLLKEIHWQLWW